MNKRNITITRLFTWLCLAFIIAAGVDMYSEANHFGFWCCAVGGVLVAYGQFRWEVAQRGKDS